MHQKHLFIMDPIEKLNFKLDSSLRMASELSRLGHQCYYSAPMGLSWNSTLGRPFAKTAAMRFDNFKPDSIQLSSSEDLNLDSFAGIHMRKEPPFDMNYISITWLLEAVGPQTKVFNAPQALRSFNEKLGIMQFPDAIGPALASCDPLQMLGFVKNTCNGDAIIKPLDLYGGRGIERLNLKDVDEGKGLEILNKATSQGTQMRLLQAFNHHIFEGEIRVFTLAGKALSWCLKKPSPGQFLANTGAGASIHPYQPSKSLAEKVEEIAGKLLLQGMPLLGFDIIGELISEINVTSPRLLQASEDKNDYYFQIATWLEQACKN